MPRPRTISEETRREIHRLKSEGYTIRYISNVTGVSVGSVAKIVHSNLELSEVDDIDARLSEIERLLNRLKEEQKDLECQKYRLLADQGDSEIIYETKDFVFGETVFYLESEGRKQKLTETNLGWCEEPQNKDEIPLRYVDGYISAWYRAKRAFEEEKAAADKRLYEECQKLDRAIRMFDGQATVAASIPESSRKQIIRTLEKSFHPDNGGRADIFADVQKVKAILTT